VQWPIKKLAQNKHSTYKLIL